MSTSRFQAGCHHHRPGPRWVHLHLGHDRGSNFLLLLLLLLLSFFLVFAVWVSSVVVVAVVNLSRVYIGGGANVTATFTGTPIHLAEYFTWLIKPRSLQKYLIIHFFSVPKVIYFRPALVTCGEKPHAPSIMMVRHIEPVDSSQGVLCKGL